MLAVHEDSRYDEGQSDYKAAHGAPPSVHERPREFGAIIWLEALNMVEHPHAAEPTWQPSEINISRRLALVGLSGLVVSAMGIERAWACRLA